MGILLSFQDGFPDLSKELPQEKVYLYSHVVQWGSLGKVKPNPLPHETSHLWVGCTSLPGQLLDYSFLELVSLSSHATSRVEYNRGECSSLDSHNPAVVLSFLQILVMDIHLLYWHFCFGWGLCMENSDQGCRNRGLQVVLLHHQ